MHQLVDERHERHRTLAQGLEIELGPHVVLAAEKARCRVARKLGIQIVNQLFGDLSVHGIAGQQINAQVIAQESSLIVEEFFRVWLTPMGLG